MYPLTVELRKPYDAQTAYNVTPGILADAIRQQFGGIEKGQLNMRLISFGLWGVADASSTAPEVNVDVSGLSALVNDNVTPSAPVGVWYGIAAKLRDVGTLNRPCKVGYIWSAADNTKVIPEDAKFEILNWAMAGTATSVLRVKLMWNFGGSAVPQGP